MNEKIDFLTNNNYKTLLAIYNHQITVEGESYCPLSQNDLANVVNVSKATMINILKQLYENDLLIKSENSKKYVLSPCALEIIKNFKKLK